MSYRDVGIPTGKIFIVDPDGKLKQYDRQLEKTYKSLAQIADMVFTPLLSTSNDPDNSLGLVNEQFNDFNFWKMDPASDEELTL